MSEPARAVFISHASQDAEAAARIVGALRGAGIEVWFDKSELRGGDAWDQRIRREIRDCALFMPVISGETEERLEAYFRREWRLAVDRTHDMADGVPFLVPVVIDGTSEQSAVVPEPFRAVQWTRLPGGETTPEFVAWIERLLATAAARAGSRAAASEPKAASPRLAHVAPAAAPARPPPAGVPLQRSWLPWAAGIVLLAAVAAALLVGRLTATRHAAAPPSTVDAAPGVAAGTVSEQSIAVLPFVNMTPDKEQEYFADGLAEELLDLLAKTPGLHVVARTSSFSFKGKSDDIPTIAAKLKVANILEGSVRRSGDRLRVTTQLVRASDGQHLWSETYDRELKDIFRVQDEIAASVVSALKLKLAPGPASAARRSNNPDAYLQFMLGQQYFNHGGEQDFRRAVATYRAAIALDPQYAAAYAGLATAEYYLADATGDLTGYDRAKAAAERAVQLAPDQAMGYAARGQLRGELDWNWAGAQADFEKALALDPNDFFVQRRYAQQLADLGHVQQAVDVSRRLTELDPYSSAAWRSYAYGSLTLGDLKSAREAALRAIRIDPTDGFATTMLAEVELLDHRPEESLAAWRKSLTMDPEMRGFALTGIAMAEYSRGNAAASQQALDEAIATTAMVSAYQIAEAYAWRGEKDKAFEWLERAYRQRDGGLVLIMTDPLMVSLHGDPRYDAMLRKIKVAA